MKLIVERIYHKPANRNGYRILVDRLWPRGISKVNAHLDWWAKEVGPSTELRKWFGHDPAKFAEFKQRYQDELAANPAFVDFKKKVKHQLKTTNVILLFGAKDEEYNQSVILKDLLDQELSAVDLQPVTAEQMRHYDSFTINTIGIPSLVLMERAALAVRDEILQNFAGKLQHVVVVAGSGNNGGDGLDVARLLHIAGVKVTILNVGNPAHASEEHQVQDKICQYYQIAQTTDMAVIDQASLIVDAMFGIGIDRDVKGNYATAIKDINESNADVVAVDMPSGINTDTGEVMGVAVQANATVTFAFNKVGLTMGDGQQYAGRVVVADDMGTYATDD